MALVGQNLISPPSAEYGTGGNLWMHVTGQAPSQALTVADRAGAAPDGGTGPRWSTGISGAARQYWTIGPLAEGEYTLTARITTLESTPGRATIYLGVVDPDSGAVFGYDRRIVEEANAESTRAEIPALAGEYETLSFSLVIADRSDTAEIRDPYNTPDGTIDLTRADYALVADIAKSQQTAFAYARLDVARADGPVGYFDGSYPPDGDVVFSWSDTPGMSVSLAESSAPTVIPVPAAEATADGYMLPEVPGVIWTVDGVEQVPGTYSVEPVEVETEVTILPTVDTGYAFDAEPVPLVLVFTPEPEPEPEPDPEPEPTPDPEPVGPFTPTPAPDEPDEPTEAAWARLMDDDPQAVYVATRLAERIIVHVGGDVAVMDPAEVLTARDHAMTVLEYVRGYVRDRGFIGCIPHRSLQAVIVSAGARLFVNPDQLTYYSTGDYSERPATLTGWTAAELGVLRRFRRTYR